MKTVLFVDDEEQILDGIKDLLRKYRHQIHMVYALDGDEALGELEKTPFDVIVTDMRMPGMDGATLLEKVRRDYPGVVRILLSGHADRDAIFKALPVAHQFLSKPCEADRLCNVIDRACRLRSLLNDEAVRNAVGGIEKLPSLPAAYHELMNAMALPDANPLVISGIIERDQAMSAKILQLVNCACFGATKQITRIHQAVVYLGMELIRNLAISVHVYTGLETLPVGAGFSFQAQQDHAILTGRVARRLLSDPQQSQDAFAAGLLHDIGKVILAVSIPERYRLVLAECRRSARPIHEVELEILGVTHAQVGAYLLGLWGLPYPIVEAVAYHHDPACAVEQKIDVTSATILAEALIDDVAEAWTGAAEWPDWKEIAKEEIEAWSQWR